MARRILLLCGTASSLLYLIATILGGLRWNDYDFASYSISELSAIGAPSRPLMIPLFLVYSLLVVAFAFGVWQSSIHLRARRIITGLLLGYGTLCMAGPFVPVHQRGVDASLTDAMHIVLTIVTVIFIVLIVAIGASAMGTRFRSYSIGTIAIVLACGTWTGVQGSRIAANLPTPWLGVTERICVFAFLLWVAVFATALWRITTVGAGVASTAIGPTAPSAI